MNDIDLIPTDYRQMLLLRQGLKNFTLIGMTVLLLCVGVYAVLSHSVGRIRDDIVLLEEHKSNITLQQTELNRLRDKSAELQQQWELLRGLRSGVAAETMLEITDRALPEEGVWFLDWKFQRLGVVVDKNPETVNTGYFIVVPRGEQNQDVATWQVQTHMTIKGQAWDHADLSEFVKRLFQQPEIQDVRVINTNLHRYTIGSVINFDMAVIINSTVGGA